MDDSDESDERAPPFKNPLVLVLMMLAAPFLWVVQWLKYHSPWHEASDHWKWKYGDRKI